MFAGIVECVGVVRTVHDGPGGRRLTIEAGPVAEDAVEGASIAVDGVCLTVAAVAGSLLDFDVIAETLARSTLGRLRADSRVNLERSLRAEGRIEGHFVQGHVDAVATLTRRQVSEREWVLWFRTSAEAARYVIPKGSVAVNGVSLTVASVSPPGFSVALIPTTLSRTTLADLTEGDEVNLETDILARTVVHTLESLERAGGLTEAKLRELGFL